MKLTFLGTGTMGAPMARNAAAAGLEVTAWNRSSAKAEALEGDGVTPVADSVEAIQDADVVVTILSEIDAVRTVVEADGVLDGLRGKVWVQMSTVGIAGTEELAKLGAANDVALVDAPVLGTKKPAEDGELIVIAAGAPETRETLTPLFDAVGKETRWLADKPGAATRMKVVLNTWIVGLVESLGETLALAEGLEVDPGAFLDVIAGGPLDSPYAQLKGKAMLARSLDPSFSLRLATKDAGLSLEGAELAGLDLPLVEAVRAQMAAGIEAGHGDKDMAATFLGITGED